MINVIKGPWGQRTNERDSDEKIPETSDSPEFRTHRAAMWIYLSKLRANEAKSQVKVFEDHVLRTEEREKESDEILRGRIMKSGKNRWSTHPAMYETIDSILDQRMKARAGAIEEVPEAKRELRKVDADRIIRMIGPTIEHPSYPDFTEENLRQAWSSVLEVDDGSANFSRRLEKILDDFITLPPDKSTYMKSLAVAMLYRNIYIDDLFREINE